MNGSEHKKLAQGDFAQVDWDNVETSLDAWIELALYTDERSVRNLHEIVGSAVKRLKWELENLPGRWVNVRERKVKQLSQWVAIQDKLRSLFVSLDDIPF